MKETQQRLAEGKVKYSYGPYNKFNKTEQWIRLTEGCPHNCPYCYEPQEYKIFKMPPIRRREVKIMDMNFLCKPQANNILKELAEIRVEGKVVYYDFVCGFDYRFMTEERAKLIKAARVKKIRLAWDWAYRDQIKLKPAIDLMKKVGYKQPSQIMVFMVCNWKLSYSECCLKLDMLKLWRVMVADCYYDNQLPPNIVPIHWTHEQIKSFRRKCRVHNRCVRLGIDPDMIPNNTN